jgi:hypothetical protein
MASYSLPIIIFGIAVLFLILDHRNGKTMGPELYSEYMKNKVPAPEYFASRNIGGRRVRRGHQCFRREQWYKRDIGGDLWIRTVYCVQIDKGKNIRKINLPADFVRRERFYDFVLSLIYILFLAVVWLI